MTSPNENKRKPNSLIREKSPYLLQHAYNPVNWFAWGDEAFQVARRENKPIFLSIGYSTCHWCHVMEKESFENEAIAAILNDNFVSIKVDREERPDIDQMYMLATQAMTGGGGWPMSVFLFADKKPFYAGTYFPPEPRYNHPGFSELLSSIDRAWKENRDALAGSAEKITSFLENSSAATANGTLDKGWSRLGFEALEQSYDKQFHGFGTNNKFPRPACISFLQTYSRMKKDTAAFTMARDTLTSMAMGGMFDHVGGGFHRYSVDRQWRIPHFEKMLYDQAQLVISYVEMYQQTGESFFGQIAQQTVEYVLRDLQHPEGGFYSAEDADSVNPYNEEEHGEGAFYLWQESEIRELLGDDADIFIAFYGVRKDGNALQDPADEFSGRNILYMSQSLQELADNSDKTTEELQSLLTRSKNKLLEKRNLRSRPHLDDKIITAWNGLMVSALSRAGRILGIEQYSEEAERGVSFVMEKLYTGGTLLRRWRDGEGRFGAVLEDYAFLVQGLLDLYDATQKSIYLQQAQQLSMQQVELFADSEGGFYSSQASEDLLTRLKETYDGAEPSGNSVSALNFLRLGRILASDQWTTRAEQTIRAFGKILQEHGIAMPLMLTALELSLAPPVQIIIAGRREEEDSKAMLSLVNSIYLPQLQVLLADGGENQEYIEESIAYLGKVVRINDKATAYLCKDFRCQTPTNDLGQLEKLIRELG